MYFPDTILAVEVVVLPLTLPVQVGDLLKIKNSFVRTIAPSDIARTKPNHLFLISNTPDRPINDGDWYINKWKEQVRIMKCIMQSDFDLYEGENFRVEATTLKKLNLPLLSANFLDKFIASQGALNRIGLECLTVNPDSDAGREGQKLVLRTCSDRTVLTTELKTVSE